MIIPGTHRVPRVNRFRHLIATVRTHAPRIASETGRVPHPSKPHRKQALYSRGGKIRSALLLWLLGVPIPIILLIFLIKGCVT